MLEEIIATISTMYLCESKEPRDSMIMYMNDGGPNENLLNLELHLIKILKIYLKEVKYCDLEKN